MLFRRPNLIMCWRQLLLLSVLWAVLLGCQAAAADRPLAALPGEQPQPSESWAVVCDWLRGQAEQLGADLEAARLQLLERAQQEAPELAARLTVQVAQPRRAGWGLLPEVLESGPHRLQEARQRSYSLEVISRSFVKSFRDGRLLAGHTSVVGDTPLVECLETYERLAKDLKNLVEHLSYHEGWQRSVQEHEVFFTKQNAILADVREWQELLAQSGDADRVLELEQRVRAAMSPFVRADGLTVETQADGARVLAVQVYTDVDDQQWLEVFRQVVDEEWNRCEASLSQNFKVELEFVVVDLDDLYPVSPPMRGAAMDTSDHLSRFPENAFVLTTGAASTHALPARALFLGPGALARRTLAHEFGHLLGFKDAYLRAFDTPADHAFGVVLVEWTGLRNDLMGHPAGGRVDSVLIDRLLLAYTDAQNREPAGVSHDHP